MRKSWFSFPALGWLRLGSSEKYGPHFWYRLLQFTCMYLYQNTVRLCKILTLFETVWAQPCALQPLHDPAEEGALVLYTPPGLITNAFIYFLIQSRRTIFTFLIFLTFLKPQAVSGGFLGALGSLRRSCFLRLYWVPCSRGQRDP